MLIKSGSIASSYINIYSLQGKKIGIPIFQRFYSWKAPQVAQLKADLLECLSNPSQQIYLLDFMYYEEDGIIKIADGQQRLVTLNLLIKAINDIISINNLPLARLPFFDITYDVLANDEKYRNNLSYVVLPFKSVYLDLKDFITQYQANIKDFISIIQNNIFIFWKKCDNADDAFEIFQQINTGGKPLTKDDVIRTAIDQYAKMYKIQVPAKKKDLRAAIITYYKLTQQNLNKNFDNMEIITFLKNFITKDKTTFQNFANIVAHLSNLKTQPMFYVINQIKRTTLLDVLSILYIKNIDVNYKRDYLNRLMIPLCMMSIVLTFKGGSPTTYRYLLNDVIKKIKANESIGNLEKMLINDYIGKDTAWKISKQEFVDKIGNRLTPRSIKEALLLIDVICRNTSGMVMVNLINLEHIYPQKPDIEWAKNGWPSHADVQLDLIENIGNYLLLNSKVNKKIKNKYITDKVVEYNIIIPKDKVLQTPMNTVDFKKFEIDKGQYIKQRQNDIADDIYNNIPFSKALIQ